jgi:hypothetical protein
MGWRLNASKAVGCCFAWLLGCPLLRRDFGLLIDRNEHKDAKSFSVCLHFPSFRVEAIDATDGMLWILGSGIARCLWFPVDMTEPARRS